MDRSKVNWSHLKFTNETELETIITIKRIFEDCFIYNAKPSINIYKGYNRHADILIIDRNYRYWSIGEVEVSSHSFSRHVYPQLVEIKSLIDTNLQHVNKRYLTLDTLSYNKKMTDLIKYNKPFLTLLTDSVPNMYRSIIPLLNTFCNLRTVNRYKNSIEEYVYITDIISVNSIKRSVSPSYILDNILFVDYPNLVDLQLSSINHIVYADTEYEIHQQTKVLHGFENLFWFINGNIKNGKYYLCLDNKKLILKKKQHEP